MTIAESSKAQKQKGLDDLMKFLQTGVKVGKTVFDVATGNYIGAAANWIPQAKDAKSAFDIFQKWKTERGSF